MKRSGVLILLLSAVSVISGYMMSKASWLGRMGISLFYKQYSFLKHWWKGAILVFGVLMLLYLLHSVVQKKLSKGSAAAVHIFALAAALTGLYLSYDDFRNTLAHRWMGERFHLGVYLLWIGWMIISVYMLTMKRSSFNVNETRH